MKNLVVLLIWSLLILGCSNKKENISKEIKTETKVETKTVSKKENSTAKANKTVESIVLSDFFKDVKSLSQVKNPIKTFIVQAETKAEKSVRFSKENIQNILDEAANYKEFVVVVENHTIIKIDNVKNCKPSGSWGACMPFAKGFIKKGKLQYQEDYCNFIIGMPSNNKKRIAYFFK